ncbi:TetR/AcrR family transcriptional repressor of nem operon [Chryseobacterium sp. H1D6B]|uniref:TetR/AcrR family transcriptional regulator n=1 Tax=Chryseobacterium sp. H1D6B TaxID=2940588 RepID=UPI0015CDC38E|nr:TetR family transcriptional regulator C-terminal domain-containing protein [Chryseobacterium sp. H1D6B]MDH6250573.1 TetR/AcrR family transcriptional repressor of nem operon [Chryseobacterium sp. H1D6B]
MAGRPKIFNEQEAVEKATQIFWDKCYDTASADELLNAIGIGKGSFYLAFKGGKQELYIRSIEQFSNAFYQKLLKGVAAADHEIEFIRQFFLSLSDTSDTDKLKGCYLGNALVQLSDKDENVKEIAAQFLKNMQQLFMQVIQKAQSEGGIKSKEDPEILAWHLSNLWNGIHVTKRMEKNPKILRTMIELNLKLLE